MVRIHEVLMINRGKLAQAVLNNMNTYPEKQPNGSDIPLKFNVKSYLWQNSINIKLIKE